MSRTLVDATADRLFKVGQVRDWDLGHSILILWRMQETTLRWLAARKKVIWPVHLLGLSTGLFWTGEWIRIPS